MTQARRLSGWEVAHILGRAGLGAAIGWSYLLGAYWLDVGGWGGWIDQSPFGGLVAAELLAIFGVAFGCTGGHIGWCNVMGPEARAVKAAAAERRVEMRRTEAWRR